MHLNFEVIELGSLLGATDNGWDRKKENPGPFQLLSKLQVKFATKSVELSESV